MTTINAELFTALKSAGTPEDQAFAAATNTELKAIENNIIDMRLNVADMRGHLKLHNWILGILTVIGLGIFWKLFELNAAFAKLAAMSPQ